MGKKSNPESIVGQKFNKLLVLKFVGFRSDRKAFDKRIGKYYLHRVRYYLCKCECGREYEVSGSSLGRFQGCMKCCTRKQNPISKHPFYRMWNAIRSANYKNTKTGYVRKDKMHAFVCKRWLLSIDAFAKDIGERPTPEHKLKRIIFKKGFTPKNCKWHIYTKRFVTQKRKGDLIGTQLAKQVGLSRERIRQITDYALEHKENELNKLIERVDYIKASKRVVYKPEAIEYFKLGKYRKTTATMNTREKVKQHYLQGKDMETVAKLLNKPIESIKRYYKMFD